MLDAHGSPNVTAADDALDSCAASEAVHVANRETWSNAQPPTADCLPSDVNPHEGAARLRESTCGNRVAEVRAGAISH